MITAAVEAAIKWFEANKIKGYRWERVNGESKLIKDAYATPIWARFYEIETMKPIFIGRDAMIKYDVSQIEAERRNGYAWYVDSAAELVTKDYPKWRSGIEKALQKK